MLIDPRFFFNQAVTWLEITRLWAVLVVTGGCRYQFFETRL